MDTTQTTETTTVDTDAETTELEFTTTDKITIALSGACVAYLIVDAIRRRRNRKKDEEKLEEAVKEAHDIIHNEE